MGRLFSIWSRASYANWIQKSWPSYGLLPKADFALPRPKKFDAATALTRHIPRRPGRAAPNQSGLSYPPIVEHVRVRAAQRNSAPSDRLEPIGRSVGNAQSAVIFVRKLMAPIEIVQELAAVLKIGHSRASPFLAGRPGRSPKERGRRIDGLRVSGDLNGLGRKGSEAERRPGPGADLKDHGSTSQNSIGQGPIGPGSISPDPTSPISTDRQQGGLHAATSAVRLAGASGKALKSLVRCAEETTLRNPIGKAANREGADNGPQASLSDQVDRVVHGLHLLPVRVRVAHHPDHGREQVVRNLSREASLSPAARRPVFKTEVEVQVAAAVRARVENAVPEARISASLLLLWFSGAHELRQIIFPDSSNGVGAVTASSI